MQSCNPVGRRLFLYNTICEIVLREYPGKASEILDACENAARNVQSMLNAYDPCSELGRLNRMHKVGKPYAVSPEFYGLLRRMDRFSKESGGVFDATVRPLVELWNFTAPNPSVPQAETVAAAMERCGSEQILYDDDAHTVTFTADGMSIDAGGVGKGYAVSLVTDCLRAFGVTSASVNFGGELYLLGPCVHANRRSDWRVGVQDPSSGRGTIIGTLSLHDQAIATSGSYDRFFIVDETMYCHVIDPRTGWPVPRGMAGVTVVCADPVKAELLSTAIFVLGWEAGARLAATQGCDYLIVSGDCLLMSEQLRLRFQAANNYKQSASGTFYQKIF